MYKFSSKELWGKGVITEAGGRVASDVGLSIEPTCSSKVNGNYMCTDLCGTRWEQQGDLNSSCAKWARKSRPLTCRKKAAYACPWAPGKVPSTAKWVSNPKSGKNQDINSQQDCWRKANGESATLDCYGDPNDWVSEEYTETQLIENLAKYSRVYGKNNDGYDQMMVTYCLSESSDPNKQCTPEFYPEAGSDLPAPSNCPRLAQVGPAGVTCRKWMTTMRYNEDAAKRSQNDYLAQEFCKKYPNSWYCKCHNREDDADFQAVNSYLKNKNSSVPIPAACWFLPCQSSQQIATTSDMDQTNCPDNICLQVQGVVDSKIVDSGFNQSMMCGAIDESNPSNDGSGAAGAGAGLLANLTVEKIAGVSLIFVGLLLIAWLGYVTVYRRRKK